MSNNNTKIRIVHIISHLNGGGSEAMLYKLIAHIDREVFDPAVIVLDGNSRLADKISAHGVSVYFMNMQNNLLSSWKILTLSRLINRLQPDIIQGWMYHANLAASLANQILGNRFPVVWNIRKTLYDMHHEPRMTQWAIRMAAKQSDLPQKIIYNSWLGAEQHAKLGFDDSRSQVIANGFDLRIFTAKNYHRTSIRHELNIPRDAIVIGMFARFHPMKNHNLFFQAANLLAHHKRHVHFILGGHQVNGNNPVLKKQLQRYPHLKNRVHLLGERRDIPALLNALDLFTLTSSHGEGFPNVVGEAMACGVPCIATDIGDIPRIIGDTGQTLQDATPSSLAFTWLDWIEAGSSWRREKGKQAAQHMRRHYNIKHITKQYHRLYQDLVLQNPIPAAPSLADNSGTISPN